ncbi:sigma 54-interacting transcriptional regulator [Chroococcus sp. FPU101]|uniref:sigma 54-interacting transcriptional regulator n=1 Tax=Chroococcus sp. FPU101 TaxID=1974212 RepID=UPI001A8D987D|nr:sigma 54-interacting transcriptional regulator [Chroococcus sp. FPU101]GFE71378.1 hypothetical protein CWATWH0003_5338 [Chroococcus sp. FPU101]
MINSNTHFASDLFTKVCQGIEQKISILVIGEAGMGMEELAQQIHQSFLKQRQTIIASYKGGRKTFFQNIANQLNIPLTDERDKFLTIEQLQTEINLNLTRQALLIFPHAERLTPSIRFWIEEMIAKGAVIVLFALKNLKKDIFLQMVDLELEFPSDQYIRQVMAQEAENKGLELSDSQLAQLQPQAGKNPLLAKQVIARQALGVAHKAKPNHTQYIVIMPAIIGALLCVGMLRMIGLGTHNRGLYITSGCGVMAIMILQQISRTKGPGKGLGE